jgi:hypothetical protein
MRLAMKPCLAGGLLPRLPALKYSPGDADRVTDCRARRQIHSKPRRYELHVCGLGASPGWELHDDIGRSLFAGG